MRACVVKSVARVLFRYDNSIWYGFLWHISLICIWYAYDFIMDRHEDEESCLQVHIFSIFRQETVVNYIIIIKIHRMRCNMASLVKEHNYYYEKTRNFICEILPTADRLKSCLAIFGEIWFNWRSNSRVSDRCVCCVLRIFDWKFIFPSLKNVLNSSIVLM